MTNKIRIVLLSAALVGTAGWLGACANQPNAGCPILGSNPAAGVPPYWMKYERVSMTGTGTCGDLKGESVGFQKYNPPGSKEFRLAYRFENLGAQYADFHRFDPTDPTGVNINGFGKIAEFPAADNFCEVTDFTGAPRDGGNYDAPSQRFEVVPGEPVVQPDGGSLGPDGGVEIGPDTPELFMRYQWTNLKFLATVNAPGTIFTGELKYTEDNCTATYKTFGLWPALNPLTGAGCDPASNDPSRNGYNPQCDPTVVTLANYSNLTDAGLFPDGGTPEVTQFGSGINPTFHTTEKPITCGATEDIYGVHHCELQLTLDEITKL